MMNFLKHIFNFIIPPYCGVCKRPLEAGEKAVCDECFNSISVIVAPFCRRCGRPTDKESVCNECIEHPHEFTRTRVLGKYEDVLRDLIHLFKYSRKISIGRRLGSKLGVILKNDELLSQADTLIPVPLYPTKKRERGYNQSEILSHAVSDYTGIPELNTVLYKIRPTKSQTELSLEERVLNVKNAFKVNRAEQVNGKKLILVDDVFTTGATLDECARELYKAGASEVYTIVCARA
ncbi:MAG: ComF family protein [bacterium]|nr:ComF family protein [bacterium]